MGTASFITRQQQEFYHLDDIRDMPEFFMTLVSSADHWMFLSSKGALTAGRGDPEHALFPYDTVDKVCAGRNNTGPRTMIRVAGKDCIWEPFADWTPQLWRSRQGIARNRAGSRVIFDETNLDLGLEFSYSWAFSRRYGFVRQVSIRNIGTTSCSLEIMDGLLNLVVPGVSRRQITEFNCLIDAYKDNVIVPAAEMAIFSLSALVVDRPEAAEALEASVAWYHGSAAAKVSLDRGAYTEFAAGRPFVPTNRALGKTNDFVTLREINLAAGAEEIWFLVAERGLDGVGVDNLIQELQTPGFAVRTILEKDISEVETKLHSMVAKADGLSVGAKPLQNWHHYSNVLFNIMRGGVPSDARKIQVSDAIAFIRCRNLSAAPIAEKLLAGKAEMEYRSFRDTLAASGNPDLARLGAEYLPLTFSRRHGDPSRPWNLFSIKVEDKQGKPVLNHQGNWRDIFQNWEALGLTYPDYLPSFVSCFLNATTLDGYNPYRVTREGAEWEKQEAHNPWSNIGYWSDHQIIYLQKLLEWMHAFQPGRLEKELGIARYSYCAVPYRIADYASICRDPKTTISFDESMDKQIESKHLREGTDARLVHDAKGAVYHGTLAEKLLSLFLAKFANLVPGGGIWMNTQRPEWNDANNALVGNGLSVVTTAQLRRFIVFWIERLSGIQSENFSVALEIKQFMDGVTAILAKHSDCKATASDARLRRAFMDGMGGVAESYRQAIYQNFRFSGQSAQIKASNLTQLFQAALSMVDATLNMLKRDDGLYHSYNILILGADSSGAGIASIKPLAVMLEGQVAILGAHYLTPDAAADLFAAIRSSALYRADQHSYMLYPARDLPDFRTKNQLDRAKALGNPLLAALLAEKNNSIVNVSNDCVRFASGLSNHRALENALADLSANEKWTSLVQQHGKSVHELYEACFHHDEFTGRSGTMYAYEGIGSIYWHMVSKLLLAAAENIALAPQDQAAVRDRLKAAYLDIRDGIGYRKSADVYGAFPWEPYSHTPAGGGAKQPGMTGQVKEEVITRFAEFGLTVEQACLSFGPAPFLKEELCQSETEFVLAKADEPGLTIKVPVGACACQVCGIPVIRGEGKVSQVEIYFQDGHKEQSGPVLSPELSDKIFSHEGSIQEIHAH